MVRSRTANDQGDIDNRPEGLYPADGAAGAVGKRLINRPRQRACRLRAEFDASLSIELLEDLDFKLTVYDRYDSDPPEGNDTNDTGLTLDLSWSY